MAAKYQPAATCRRKPGQARQGLISGGSPWKISSNQFQIQPRHAGLARGRFNQTHESVSGLNQNHSVWEGNGRSSNDTVDPQGRAAGDTHRYQVGIEAWTE